MKFSEIFGWFLIAGITIFICFPVSAIIQSPSIEIKPVSGAVGSSVSVKGEGFSINSEVRVFWEDKLLLATSKTSSDGKFSASITVPEVPCGYYRITAVDEVKYNAYATFRVTPKITKISTTKGAPGTVVSISGNGFSANSVVEIKFVDPFNESWIIMEKRVQTSSSGVIQTNFEIPNVAEGDYRIFAIDSKTGLKTDYSKFTVVAPKTTATPTPTPTSTPLKDQNKTSQPKPTTTPKTAPKTPVTYSPKSTPGFELLVALGGIATAFLISRKI